MRTSADAGVLSRRVDEVLTGGGAGAPAGGAGSGRSAERRAAKDDVLESIRKMGVLQIDSIAVVARSPYLVLWSRLGSYEPAGLTSLRRGLSSSTGRTRPASSRSKTTDCTGGSCSRVVRRAGLVFGSPGGDRRVLARLREGGGALRRVRARRRAGRRLVGVEAGETGARAPVRRGGVDDLAPRPELPPRLRPARARAETRSARLGGRPRADYEEVRRALALKAVRGRSAAVARWVPDYFRTPRKGIASLLDELADEGSFEPR